MPGHLTSRPLAKAFDRAFPVFPRESSVIDMIKAFRPIDLLIADLYIGEISFAGLKPIMLDPDGNYSEIVPSLQGWTSCMERIARRMEIQIDLSFMRRIGKRLESGVLIAVDDVDRIKTMVNRCRAIYLACPVFIRKAAVVDEMIDIAVDELGLRRAA